MMRVTPSILPTHGELGRYPFLIKQIVLGILYWWRLEQGTDTSLLNKAFIVMKEKTHPSLQNIKYLLYKLDWETFGLVQGWAKEIT